METCTCLKPIDTLEIGCVIATSRKDKRQVFRVDAINKLNDSIYDINLRLVIYPDGSTKASKRPLRSTSLRRGEYGYVSAKLMDDQYKHFCDCQCDGMFKLPEEVPTKPLVEGVSEKPADLIRAMERHFRRRLESVMPEVDSYEFGRLWFGHIVQVSICWLELSGFTMLDEPGLRRAVANWIQTEGSQEDLWKSISVFGQVSG